jgi:hypothetical protein
MIIGKWIFDLKNFRKFDLKNFRKYDNMPKVFDHNRKAFKKRLNP